MITKWMNPDDSCWNDFLSIVPHDIYHLPEYVLFSSRHEGGTPIAFYAEEGKTALLIPFLKHELPKDIGPKRTGFDLLSPYGYPGPLVRGELNELSIYSMLTEFMSLGKELNVVSSFFRLHPLLDFPANLLKNFGTLKQHGQTVSCRLDQTQEEIWKETSQNHKRNIRKLKKSGFHTERNNWQRWPEFISIYNETMHRVEAKDFYFFSELYFDDLKSTLADKLDFWAVLSPQGELAAGAIFFVADSFVGYHLGGTGGGFLKEAPSKLLFSDAREWARDIGKRFLHLGGGLGAANDSLFKFKTGFSKNLTNFFTFRAVVDPQIYYELAKSWTSLAGETKQDIDYFPLYRSPLR